MACPQFISIHAPARGATGCVRFSTLYPSDFNPRSRKGSDQIERMEPTDLMISIHAPARGATYRRMSCALLNQFQSTLPQGERRLIFKYLSHSFSYFNPRSRKGSDSTRSYWQLKTELFQSTLPQGERRLMERSYNATLGISIHAPARGATIPLCASDRKMSISIHAPARGAT